MKLAIIGTGISGMVCAHLLHPHHDLTIFEANDYVGGHTNTVNVAADGQELAVDTGFIVFNDWTYPNFIALLKRLGVASKPTTMSFSVHDDASGLEYNGTSINHLFAQRRNLFRPSFHRMWRDILRFNREAKALLATDDHVITLGEYVDRMGFSRQFTEHYLIPMGAAVWSAPPAQMRQFPIRYFVQFFENHGFLSVNHRPQWRVVTGGSKTYAQALITPMRQHIRLNTPISTVRRFPDHVQLTLPDGTVESFDQVIIAAHGDQALRMLADPSQDEQNILRAFTYQANEAILHTDIRQMPERKLAWAAWNYRLPEGGSTACSVTYDMNMLQGLKSSQEFLVTLNRGHDIHASKILRRIQYHHPVFTVGAVAAKSRHAAISGVNRTHFCGAYWGYGFHEDGVNSALAVGKQFGVSLNDQVKPTHAQTVAPAR